MKPKRDENGIDELKLSFDEMIYRLDTACGMLLVASMRDNAVRKAMEMVTLVSVSLGEWAQDFGQDGGTK